MAVSIKASVASSRVSCARPIQRVGRSRSVVLVKAEKAGEGYIQNDNSGRGNIFPTTSKPYITSPTSTAVASTGLGGAAGIAVLAGAVVAIGLATALVASNPSGETLATVVSSYDGEALSTIAQRISASL